MKERLLSEGFSDIGGCNCGGGARYYNHPSYPNFRINDYYKRGFLTLLFQGHKRETYNYERIETLLEDIKKPI